uniref:non-specific serine/threonine protein kinase n=1 Tax=Rhizophora mucronata TaxID=61149 RepID=A0A2P2MHV7_RHIMU
MVKMNGDTVQLPGWGAVTTRTDYYYRATLDFDGVFTQYAHPKNSSVDETWSIVNNNFVPQNICMEIISDLGSGYCGYNSYCSVQNSTPSCHCPPKYALADPQNPFGDCIPTFPLGCVLDDGSRAPEELYEFNRTQSIDWPLNDYGTFTPSNQSQCEDSCMHDCSCAVAIYRDNQCWKKRLPLSNGRTEPKDAIALFKVRKEVRPGCSRNEVPPERVKSVVLGAVLGCSAFLNLLLLVLAPLILLKLNKRRLQDVVQNPNIFETNLRSFAYEELKEATDCFREELGRGSFGVVYKGVLKSGSKNVIAVKKLDKIAQEGEREFRTEVSAIGKTHHKNLVRLLGYCIEGSNRLLIYEFMSNGTLASFLFTHQRPNWHQRVRIALGIAKGLLYLHEDCDVPIIHCDIKPPNILLDDHLNAKISDFGLAKLLLLDQTRTLTVIRGTRGYVAPEWFKNVPVTTKVDVYSFGVLLLEIICCRKSVQMEADQEERAILTDWAYDCYVEGRIDLLLDNDEVATSDMGRLQSWVMIAFWCIQEDPSKRPTMKKALEMLEGFVEVPSPTCPSSF